MINFKQVEKVLGFIAKYGYDAVTKATDGIDNVKKWQSLHIEELHQFESAIKRVEEPFVKKFLQAELCSRRVRYKAELRRKVNVRRFYKAVKDFYSWWIHTKYIQYKGAYCGHTDYYAELAREYRTFADMYDHESTWNKIVNKCSQHFILTTPFKFYDKPMQFYAKNAMPWMEEALKHDGYVLNAVKLIKKEQKKPKEQ